MLDKTTVANVVEFVKVTGELLSGYQEKVASLEKQLGTVQKEASKSVSIDKDAATRTVANMIKAKFIDKAEKEAALSQIVADPSVLLQYIDKLAEREATAVKPMARVTKTKPVAAEGRESDRVFEETFRNLRSRI
jgi:hypothetical protein